MGCSCVVLQFISRNLRKNPYILGRADRTFLNRYRSSELKIPTLFYLHAWQQHHRMKATRAVHGGFRMKGRASCLYFIPKSRAFWLVWSTNTGQLGLCGFKSVSEPHERQRNNVIESTPFLNSFYAHEVLIFKLSTKNDAPPTRHLVRTNPCFSLVMISAHISLQAKPHCVFTLMLPSLKLQTMHRSLHM